MNRVISVTLRIVQFICYIAMAGCIFGAWPVLFGNGPGKVPPDEWAKAKVISVIVPFVCLAVSLGARALDKRYSQETHRPTKP